MTRVFSLAAMFVLATVAAFFITKTVRSGGDVAEPAGMVFIPGGEFTMGTDDKLGWPDEKPAHRVFVDAFWIDAHEVTNAEFRKFVEATGYKTTAERAPTLEEIMSQSAPGTPPPKPEDLVPGSLVFSPTTKAVALTDYTQWWRWVPGANWQHPDGPESDIKGRDNYPVVQVSWDDAVAYCNWAGKRLPTEAEWEFAARGKLDGKRYTWGDESPEERRESPANTWQGNFPYKNSKRDGYERLAPVKSFPPNGYGLYDMAGNVWEWCNDWYDVSVYRQRIGQGLIRNPTGPAKSYNPDQPYSKQRSQRGGSFMCSDEYCTRYRPSARQGSSVDTGMSHVGFRCVWTPDKQAAKNEKNFESD